MAIKRTDCVVRISDLIIDYREKQLHRVVGDYAEIIPVYQPYWGNFLQHVKETTVWDSANAWDENMNRQLAKFNATYKRTKKYADHYIKFKTEADYAMFVLRWS